MPASKPDVSAPANSITDATPRLRHLVVGTAGHIDHGKTSLVKALTGIDTDTQQEEKARGITIDLGFASLATDTTSGAPLKISFVDVPGHARFVRNMLAGVGGIHCVLLVIAADDGIKPQTIEHLDICKLLNVPYGITVLSKADAVAPERLQQVQEDVTTFLAGSFLDTSRSPLLAVSALAIKGLPELVGALQAIAEKTLQADVTAPPRLPVDRCFSLKGVGTVVTGTLVAGSLRRGQLLVVQPGNREVRIKGLQIHSQQVQEAGGRTRVAINLSGTTSEQIQRGDTLVPPNSYIALQVIDTRISLLPQANALKHGGAVHFHAFASDAMARVALFDRAVLMPGETALARLKLSVPILIARGDRFILRQPLPAGTIGGGLVLDTGSPAGLKKKQRFEWLQELDRIAAEDRALELLKRVDRRGTAGLSIATAGLEMALGETDVRSLLLALTQNGSVQAISSTTYLTSANASLARKTFQDHLAKLLSAHPKAHGIRKAELLEQSRLPADVFAFTLNSLLAAHRIRVSEELIVPADFSPEFSDAERQTQRSILMAFARSALAARSIPDVLTELGLDPKLVRHLITPLLKQRLLIPIDSASYLHHRSIQTLMQKLEPWKGRAIEVSSFKELTGLSRKHAIPLLEFLDRSRVTRRIGDARLVL